jgi:hypothetical protein
VDEEASFVTIVTARVQSNALLAGAWGQTPVVSNALDVAAVDVSSALNVVMVGRAAPSAKGAVI